MGFCVGGEVVAFWVVPFYLAVELFEYFVEEGDTCYYALDDVSGRAGMVPEVEFMKDLEWDSEVKEYEEMR